MVPAIIAEARSAGEAVSGAGVAARSCFDTCFTQLYDARLMLGSWSATIDPIQLADTGARLAGELSVKGMSRLVEMCLDDDGSVRVDLQFERGPSDGMRVMHGTIAARVHLRCQRCMGRMPVELTSRPRLLLLRPGEREDLLEAGDAVVIEQPLALSVLVEDELLLEMPMVPMHSPGHCSGSRTNGAAEQKHGARPNPFSVLEKLKKHTDR